MPVDKSDLEPCASHYHGINDEEKNLESFGQRPQFIHLTGNYIWRFGTVNMGILVIMIPTLYSPFLNFSIYLYYTISYVVVEVSTDWIICNKRTFVCIKISGILSKKCKYNHNVWKQRAVTISNKPISQKPLNSNPFHLQKLYDQISLP